MIARTIFLILIFYSAVNAQSPGAVESSPGTQAGKTRFAYAPADTGMHEATVAEVPEFSAQHGYGFGRQFLTTLPVRDIDEVIRWFPGVVQQNGELHIRGSRPEQINYLIEGATVRDIMTGEHLLTVIPEALQATHIQGMTPNVDFGNSVGGTIHHSIRSGAREYRGSLRAEGDSFTSPNQAFLDTYSYGYRDITATFEGPLPGFDKKATFFLAGQNQYYRDSRRAFWEGFEFENLVEERGGNGDSIAVLTVEPGNIPAASQNRWLGNGVLDFDLSPFKLRALAAFAYQHKQDNQLPVQHIFNLRRIPEIERSDALISLDVQHRFGSNSKYNLAFDYFDSRGKKYDPLFEDNYFLYSDSVANAQEGFNFRTRTGPPEDYNFYGFPFDRPGKPLTQYSKFKQNYWQLRFNLQQQIANHELSLGGSFQNYTLRYYNNLENNLTNQHRSQLILLAYETDLAHIRPGTPEYEQFLFEWFTRSRLNAFGYDAFGNEIDTGFDAPKHPQLGAIYLQDRIHLNHVLFSFGTRLEFFNLDDRRLKNPTDPAFERIAAHEYLVRPDAFERVGWKLRWSPRLLLEYRPSETTSLYVRSGLFYQTPPLRTAYAGYYYNNGLLLGSFLSKIDVIGYDLDPIRSQEIDLGFKTKISEFSTINVTAYFREITNQIQRATLLTESGSISVGYDLLLNGDESNIRGVEILTTLHRTQRLAAWFTLAYQEATGTFTEPTFLLDEGPGLYANVLERKLDFEQRLRGSANLDFRFDERDGKILENFGLNLFFTFHSGHPYTGFQADRGIGPIPSHLAGLAYLYNPQLLRPFERIIYRTPLVSEFNLRVYKSLPVGKFDVTFYVYLQNLLNSRNALNVYERTGDESDDGFLSEPGLSRSVIEAHGPRYEDFYRAINLGHRQHYWELTGNDIFNTPRQIRFGFSVIL